MSCAISGEVPQEPMVSMKSGHVFEKRLIEKHLSLTSTCPITKEDLTMEDLIPLQTSSVAPPRPSSATSLPKMINSFQDEWDALVLETFTLKQHVQTLRQQLAHALYQNDAACRVIARLVQERDEAKNALTDTKRNVAQSAGAEDAGDSMDVDSSSQAQGINGVMGVMQATSKKLAKKRKKRVKAATQAAATPTAVAGFEAKESFSFHKASAPGVVCLDMHPSQPELLISGGMDNNAIISNSSSSKIVAKLTGHKKRLNDVLFHPTENVVFTASADHTAKIWTQDRKGSYSAAHTLRDHKDSVTGCALHPSGSFLVTASRDKTWSFYDIENGSLRQTVAEEIPGGYTSVKFHPDGLILGCGTEDSLVRIFDMTQQANVATFTGHTGEIAGLAFSEDGKHLASGDTNGVIKLWDLRKLSNFQTITLPNKAPVTSLRYDNSGTFLGVTSQDVRLYHKNDTWEQIARFAAHSDLVTGLRFGPDVGSVVTSSMDRTIKLWA